ASIDEILTEYRARKEVSVNLVPALKASKPYRLLNPDEVAEFIEIHRLRRTPFPNPNPNLLKAADQYYLGDVYFNTTRTLALTSITTFCGSLCGASNWKVFEKIITGRWEERAWVTCHTVF